MRSQGISAMAAMAVMVAAAGTTFAGQAAREPQSVVAVNGDVQVVYVQGNVHMVLGAGPNIAASIGPNGILMVDSGRAPAAERVIATLRPLSRNPIQYILNTQFGDEHTGGNEAFAKVGRRLVGGEAVILAHEKVLNRMAATTGSVNPRPVAAWPTDTFFVQRKEVYFNGEPVQMFHRPAVTDGDSIVFFRKSDVIVTGDVFMTTSYPRIDVAAGGHIDGVIETLNDIVDLTVPANNVEDGTIVIPGHGRLADELDVAVYRDMVTIIRDRVRDAIARGQTLAQITADRRITLEYEGRYGSTTGAWTTAMFLDAIYRNLTAK
jgi:glyoxylase-like metal-dependent hydrolase (beta-lactamase superfamily II)